MKCTEFENVVNAYVDNEVNDRNIEEHLETCEKCKRLYEETLEVKQLLNDLELIDLPADFEQTLHDKLVEVNNEKKVTPIRRFRSLKAVGSIAAVAVLSVLAFRAGTLMPMGSDNNMALDTANVAYNDMDMADASDDVTTEMSIAMDVAESAEEEMYTLGTAPKALRMETPINYAKESVTYFISPAESRGFDERWIEALDFKELMYYENNIEFYISENDFDAFDVAIKTNLMIEDNLILDNSKYLDEIYTVFDERKNNISDLESKLSQATESEKAEIEETLLLEREALTSFEYDVMNIDYYRGYKKIIIINKE